MRIDLRGHPPFGLLTAIKVDRVHPKQGYFWLCRCACGKKKAVLANALLTGNTTSCGCDKSRKCREANLEHGMTRTPTWNSWRDMRDRCENENHHKYHLYGGRGVRVCRRWAKFTNFLADMGERPVGTTIDRRDRNGHYTPNNCRWATAKEQANNTRRNRRFTYRGREYTMKQLAEMIGVPYPRLRWRLVEAGLSVEEAVAAGDRRSDS